MWVTLRIHLLLLKIHFFFSLRNYVFFFFFFLKYSRDLTFLTFNFCNLGIENKKGFFSF